MGSRRKRKRRKEDNEEDEEEREEKGGGGGERNVLTLKSFLQEQFTSTVHLLIIYAY